MPKPDPKIFTLQTGTGHGTQFESGVHSETIGASDLPDAIAKAKDRLAAITDRRGATVVRLLFDNGTVAWVRPIDAI